MYRKIGLFGLTIVSIIISKGDPLIPALGVNLKYLISSYVFPLMINRVPAHITRCRVSIGTKLGLLEACFCQRFRIFLSSCSLQYTSIIKSHKWRSFSIYKSSFLKFNVKVLCWQIECLNLNILDLEKGHDIEGQEIECQG